MFGDIYCEICGINQAKYKCKSCGRKVCEEHFNKDLWLCVECEDKYVDRQTILKEEFSNIVFYGLSVIAVVILMAIGSIMFLINSRGIGAYISTLFPSLNYPDYVYQIAFSIIFFVVSIIFLGLFLKYSLKRIFR